MIISGHRRPRASIKALAVLACLASAQMAPLPASAQGPATVTIKDFDFAPMTVTVHAGDTVTWINQDDEPHTVTSVAGLFRSGALDQGDSFKFRFDKPGTYKYLCSIHPKMMAAIIVK